MSNVISFVEYKERRKAQASMYDLPLSMQMQLSMWRLFWSAQAVQAQMGLILTSRGQ